MISHLDGDDYNQTWSVANTYIDAWNDKLIKRCNTIAGLKFFINEKNRIHTNYNSLFHYLELSILPIFKKIVYSTYSLIRIVG